MRIFRKFRRAQVTFEFMLTLGFLIIIFLLVMVYFNQKTAESSDLKSYLDGQRICTAVANNINIILQEGDGYYKNFSIPEDVYLGNNYTMVLCKNQIYINWGKRSYYCSVFTSDINVYGCESSECKSFSSGCNISPGENKVSNIGGKIYIS